MPALPPSPRDDLHGLPDAVEHVPQLVEVGMSQPHPRVGHVAGLHRLRGRSLARQVVVDHRIPELAVDEVESLVVDDGPVLRWSSIRFFVAGIL